MSKFPARVGIAFLLLAASVACERTQPVYHGQFLAFGTIMELTLLGTTPTQAEQITQALEADFALMHETWHAWDPGPVVRVNERFEEGGRFSAPTSILKLLRLSKELAAQSDHLFNPAVGRLVSLWGFHGNAPECRRPPDPAVIEMLLDSDPTLDDVHIDGFHLSSDNPDVSLDFGAIGKGYGIDIAIERLREMGVSDAIVNGGGDLRAIGSRDGKPWRIAIRGPRGGGVLGILPTQGDESVFTSGDYERNFTWKGRTYHHIIDPRTGYPATGAMSVTVAHPDAATADAAATALFVAGADDWHRIARQMGVKYVLLVDADGRIHMNPGMQQRVELQDDSRELVISPPL